MCFRVGAGAAAAGGPSSAADGGVGGVDYGAGGAGDDSIASEATVGVAPDTADGAAAAEEGGLSARPPPWDAANKVDAAAVGLLTSGNDVLLVVQHSNSSRLAVATYADFLASNTQMTSFDASRFAVTHLNLADRLLVSTGLVAD